MFYKLNGCYFFVLIFIKYTPFSFYLYSNVLSVHFAVVVIVY